MRPWLEESDYRDSDTAADVDTRMRGLVEALGLDHFSYMVLSPPRDVPFTIENTIRTSYPEEWIGRYAELRYFEVDPVAALSKTSTQPFYWGQGRFLRGFKKLQRIVFDEARCFDISYGLAIPMRGPAGETGVFNVVSSNRRYLHEVTRGKHARLFSAAFGTHERIMRQEMACADTGENAVELSLRERECLQWTMEGKTARDIATILGLSVSTVNHHASSAVRKLGALNKHHAAVKAMKQGLIR